MIYKNTLAYFVLLNDIFGNSILSKEEFYLLRSKFDNKDMSKLPTMPLWEILDLIDDKALAEKIYLAFQNFDKKILEKLEKEKITILVETDLFYPKNLTEKLKEEAPPIIYVKGNLTLFNNRNVAVVGSRNVNKNGEKFARDIGEVVANENGVLTSGGARGSDRIATVSAIKNGGKALWFMAAPVYEALKDKQVVKWLKEEKLALCWDTNPFADFSGTTALRRNKYIYANSALAFVCQCNSKISGTFSGARNCLKNKLCELYVYESDNSAVKELIKLGAIPIEEE